MRKGRVRKRIVREIISGVLFAALLLQIPGMIQAEEETTPEQTELTEDQTELAEEQTELAEAGGWPSQTISCEDTEADDDLEAVLPIASDAGGGDAEAVFDELEIESCDLQLDTEDIGTRSEKLDLTVKLPDGTVCEASPVECPDRLTSGGKTYSADYAGGVYQVEAPGETDALLVRLSALPGLTEGETIQNCAFFSRWDGYLAEQEQMWYLYPSFLDGGKGVYTAASEAWQNEQQVQFYPTEYSEGEYTLPLEKFMLNQAEITQEQVSVYGELDNDRRYAEICIGIFDAAEGRMASALLLVKLDGENGEATELREDTEFETETESETDTDGMAADDEIRGTDSVTVHGENVETELLFEEIEAQPGIEYAVSEADLAAAYSATGKQLADMADAATPQVASISGEWQILGLARSGQPVNATLYSKYLANVVQTVTSKNGVLHEKKYTEYSRVILALTAIGADVTDVGGYNLLEPLADYDQTVWQGVNGAIYALIAFDSHNYEIPAAPQGKTQTTREKLISCILGQEISGGGWAISGNVSDPDVTAMAIQGLAPYYKSNTAVKAAVDRGLARLSALQQADGGYSSYGSSCSESCAQVIVALTALGIDPQTDSRFIKNGKTVLDGLMMFSLAEGGFQHVADAGRDQMATEQAYYAMAAYSRFKNGGNSLYDMTDVVIKSDEERAAEAQALFYALPSRVTLQDKEAIRSAMTVYNSLGAGQKTLIAQDAIVRLLNAQQSLEKLEVENAQELIAAIGTVTLAKESTVNTAAAAYNLLSETQKAQVSNAGVLQAALDKLNVLKAAQTEKTDGTKETNKTGTASGDGASSGSSGGTASGSTKPGSTTQKNTGSTAGKAAASGTTKSVSVPVGAAKTSGTSGTGVSSGTTASGGKKVSTPTAAKTPDYTEAAMAVIEKIRSMIEEAAGEGHSEFSDRMTDEIIQLYRQYDALGEAERLAVEQEPEFREYKGLLEQIGRQNHVDQISGINLEENDEEAFPWYVQLVVNPQLADEDQLEVIHQVLGEDCAIFSMNDIHFVSVLDGSAWEPEEILRVRLPMVDLGDYENAVIIHLKDDGAMEFLEARASGSYLEFDAPGFSVYGIAGVNGSVEDLLRIKESRPVWPWAAAGGSAAVAVLLLLVSAAARRRRKSMNGERG